MPNSLADLVVNLTANTAQFSANLQKAAVDAKNSGEQVSSAFRGIPEQMDKLKSAAREGADGMVHVKESFAGAADSALHLGAVFAGLGAAFELRELANTLKNIQNAQIALSAAAGSAAKGAEEFEWLGKVADKLGFEDEQLAQSYGRLAIATKGTRLEGEKTREMFLGLATAAKGMGGDTESLNELMELFTRSLSRSGDGTVQLTQLRRVLAQIPGGFHALALAIGVSDEKLSQMMQRMDGAEGAFLKAAPTLYALSQTLGKEFAKNAELASDSIASLQTRIANSFEELFLSAGSGGFSGGLIEALHSIDDALRSTEARELAAELGGALASGARAAGDAIKWLGDNTWVLKSAFAALLEVKFAGWVLDGISASGRLTAWLREAAAAEEAVAAATAVAATTQAAAAESAAAKWAASQGIATVAMQAEAAAASELAKVINLAEVEEARWAASQGMATASTEAETAAIVGKTSAIEGATAATTALHGIWLSLIALPAAVLTVNTAFSKDDQGHAFVWLRDALQGKLEDVSPSEFKQGQQQAEKRYSGIQGFLESIDDETTRQFPGRFRFPVPKPPEFAYQKTSPEALDLFAKDPNAAQKADQALKRQMEALGKFFSEMERFKEKTRGLLNQDEGDPVATRISNIKAQLEALDQFKANHPEAVWTQINAQVNELNQAMADTEEKQKSILAKALADGDRKAIAGVMGAPVAMPALVANWTDAELARFKVNQADQQRLIEQAVNSTVTDSQRYQVGKQELDILYNGGKGKINAEQYAAAMDDLKRQFDANTRAAVEFGSKSGQAFQQSLLFSGDWHNALKAIGMDLFQLAIKLTGLADDFTGMSKKGGATGILGSFLSGLIPHASGGDVEPGVGYLVGEQGPEPFFPKTAGTILPNSSLKGMGGRWASYYIDARGSNAADVEARVHRALAQVHGEAVRTSVAAQTELDRRRPAHAQRF